MYYTDVDIKNILDDLRNNPQGLQFVNAESHFMWDQLVRKMGRDFEIHYLDDIPSLFNANAGLFKPNVYIIKWTKGIQDDFDKFTRKYPLKVRLIIRMTDSDDDDGNELRLKWLRNHNQEDMINAFLKWLADRGARAERGAIEVLLNTLTADEIKNMLDYVALRDDGLVTEAAIRAEMQTSEENIFQLQEDLIFGRKDQMLHQLDLLLEKSVPLQILASLTTQTRRIMQAMQAKEAKATAEQLAEVAGMSPGYARRCLDMTRNPFFKSPNSVLLFNALIGLRMQIIGSGDPLETLRIGLLKYIVDVGYAGA